MSAILAGVGPGDEVIMPSFTFVSTANAFVLRGATPVFVDIRPDTLNLDEARIEAAITPRTRAIVAVHYAGVGCEMDTITEIAREVDSSGKALEKPQRTGTRGLSVADAVTLIQGKSGTELTIGTAGYARVAVTNNVANWANASGATATKVNANIITFPQATADWGTIVAFAVMDASTAGNFLWWGAVNAPSGKVINNGDTLSFPATTGLTFTLD